MATLVNNALTMQ